MYKLTHELIYIIVDLASKGAPIKNDASLHKLTIGNVTINHYFAKMYRLNGNSINFRDLWHYIQTINLHVTFIKIDNKVYHVTNGCINIHLSGNILDTLLCNMHKMGSQEGDDKITRTIYNTFLQQNL